MYDEPGSAHRYAPDGLTGQALDTLINRAYAEAAKAPRPTSALLDGTTAEQRRHRIQRRASTAVIHPSAPSPPERPRPRDRWGGGGMTLIDGYHTRPGGPNRHERAHRVGVAEPLMDTTEERGMLQVQTCVSAHCHQCGDALGDPGFETHYPTEDAALDAAAAQGWRVGLGGRLWCSACGPVLSCEAEGHEFTPWRAVLLCVEEVHELLAGTEHTATPAGGYPVGREYRFCWRCRLHESRPSRWLIGGSAPGEGESTVAARRTATQQERQAGGEPR